MKKRVVFGAALVALVTAGTANAADIPAKARAYAPAPAAAVARVSWTGFYVGGHIGWGGVRSSSTIVSDPSGSFPAGFTICCDRDGVIPGAQLGFNWQAGNWVLGVEADWSLANSRRTVVSNSPVIAGVTRTTTGNDYWFATATGRIGFAQDNWLVYGKGGAAWFNDRDGVTLTGVPGAGTVTFDNERETHIGWTAGAGIEWALWSKWSAKVEYNYMDFGTDHHSFTALTPPVAAGTVGVADIPHRVHAVKLGVNYRFGP